MSKKITIKDIAKHAGVSIGTVDRVLHNRGNVSPEVQARVLEHMRDMGYEPNLMARSLANNKKSLNIAVILPDYTKDLYWIQPKEGVEWAEQSVKHYGVVIDFYFFSLFDPKVYLVKLTEALAQNPDAILVASVFKSESLYLLDQAAALNIPVVMINTYIHHTHTLTYIGQDSFQSGILAGRLLNFGLNDGDHAMILSLDKEVSNANHLLDKEQGFKRFFEGQEKKSIEIHTAVFEDFDDPLKMRQWLQSQLSENPLLTGFFVTNSRAYKLADAADSASLKRIKIVGFDLIEPNLSHLAKNNIRFLINQNAWHQGYLGILSIVNFLLLKKEIPLIQHLPLDIIVKENVEYYLKRTLEMPMVVM